MAGVGRGVSRTAVAEGSSYPPHWMAASGPLQPSAPLGHLVVVSGLLRHLVVFGLLGDLVAFGLLGDLVVFDQLEYLMASGLWHHLMASGLQGHFVGMAMRIASVKDRKKLHKYIHNLYQGVQYYSLCM